MEAAPLTRGQGVWQKQHDPKEEEANRHHPTRGKGNSAPPKGEQGRQHHPGGGGRTTTLTEMSLTSVNRSKLHWIIVNFTSISHFSFSFSFFIFIFTFIQNKRNGRAINRRSGSQRGGERAAQKEEEVPLSFGMVLLFFISFGWCCFHLSFFWVGLLSLSHFACEAVFLLPLLTSFEWCCFSSSRLLGGVFRWVCL